MEETNELMTVEEIEDTEEENVETEKDNTALCLAGAGLVGLVLGVLTHKFARPIADKIKSRFKKNNDSDESDVIEVDCEDVSDDEEEDD